MTLVADQIRIPGTGELRVGLTTAAAPTDESSALTGFTGLGYTQDSGVTLGRAITRDPVTAWQSVTPVKYIYTGLDLTVSAAMLQSQNEVAALWWGADFAETVAGSGKYKSDLPTVPTAVERSVVLDWQDEDGHKHRLYLPKAEVSDTGDVTLSRSATAFQISFSAMAPDTGNVLATWFTDDPAFAPAP